MLITRKSSSQVGLRVDLDGKADHFCAAVSVRLRFGKADRISWGRSEFALFDVLNRRLHTMFKFIKQLISPEDRRTTRVKPRKPTRRKQEGWDPTESIPAPEVHEGNDNTDWDLWQCSVDSQMQPLSPGARAQANTRPSQLDALDPFARVSKNSDL